MFMLQGMIVWIKIFNFLIFNFSETKNIALHLCPAERKPLLYLPISSTQNLDFLILVLVLPSRYFR